MLFIITPLDDTPYRRMGMSYQIEEIVVPALAHVVGSGITVDCGIMYVPNGWWKQVGCLVWCLSTRVFCGMIDGLAFLPVLDLTNGIHLLRTLCPDDPPEAAELLDYFDSKYSCNCTKNCIFKVWTLKCRLLAWQFKQ
jgi:hypothetical protein